MGARAILIDACFKPNFPRDGGRWHGSNSKFTTTADRGVHNTRLQLFAQDKGDSDTAPQPSLVESSGNLTYMLLA